jgi:hypothetical protein
MYFVNGIVPGLCDENGAPNRKFITRMQMIKLQDIEEAVIKIFDDEASPNLYFHNSAFVKSIANHVELLSTSEKLPEEDYIILKLSTIFLFTGFITDYEKPVEASIRLASELLPKYGFSQSDIALAARLIRNSFNEIQETLSDRILHDARYDYLGRVDYQKLTEKLLRERTEYGKHTDSKTWIQTQKKLLHDHDFLTKTARLLRNIPVEEQIAGLEKM